MNKLLLLSGNDIPFIGAETTIHQPTLKQIAFLGENNFYLGNNLLCFSKQKLSEQDKINLKNQNNFDILMSIINSNEKQVNLIISSIELIFTLIFPAYQLKIMPNILLLNNIQQNKENNNSFKKQIIINQDNFEELKSILTEIFCLQGMSRASYNPANQRAASIAKKLEQRHKKLTKKGSNELHDINILSHYISILAIGNHHTIPQLMDYTVYQLFNEFQRFEKKYNYDLWFQAKLAGAENLENVDSWLLDQSSKSEKIPSSRRIEF